MGAQRMLLNQVTMWNQGHFKVVYSIFNNNFTAYRKPYINVNEFHMNVFLSYSMDGAKNLESRN